MRERKGISTRQERKIWDLMERRLVYGGVEGKVYFYFDGFKDHLVFTDFPSGSAWDKLKRSLLSLRRQTACGRYEVNAGKEAARAEIVLHYFLGEQYQGFEKIWQDLTVHFPKQPGLITLGEVVRIREFTLQDLLVGD